MNKAPEYEYKVLRIVQGILYAFALALVTLAFASVNSLIIQLPVVCAICGAAFLIAGIIINCNVRISRKTELLEHQLIKIWYKIENIEKK